MLVTRGPLVFEILARACASASLHNTTDSSTLEGTSIVTSKDGVDSQYLCAARLPKRAGMWGDPDLLLFDGQHKYVGGLILKAAPSKLVKHTMSGVCVARVSGHRDGSSVVAVVQEYRFFKFIRSAWCRVSTHCMFEETRERGRKGGYVSIRKNA